MFDLCEPMKGCHTDEVRRLFMEGDLKLKDCTSKVSFTSMTMKLVTLTLKFLFVLMNFLKSFKWVIDLT